jgi:hypothetical protein
MLDISPEELTKIALLRKHTALCKTLMELFLQKVHDIREEIKQRKTSRRVEDSYYKMISHVNYFSKMMVIFMLYTEDSFASQQHALVTKFTAVSYSTAQKIHTKLIENQWSIITQIFSKFMTDINKKKK